MKIDIKKRNNCKGITLIALVITIIVLLILAAVSIAILTGDNGILTKATDAKKNTIIEEEKEQIKLAYNASLTKKDYDGIIIVKELNEELNKLNTEAQVSNENPIKVTFSKTGNIYTIDNKGIITGPETSEVDPFETVANKPDIEAFEKTKTYYVEWNLNEAETEYIPNEIMMQNGIEPSKWYDYKEGINHWANIKTTGGGNDCYWVWIPRYAYCITEGYHTDTAQTIDIKFLQGITNIPIDGSNIEIKNETGGGNWNVHPAFWFDKNNNGIEDEGEQLTGIWVAKFEASSNSSLVVENPTAEQLAIDGGSSIDTDLKVRVKPNVTSWRNITVNNIFTVCKNLTKPDNSLSGENNTENTNIDSHMMKNTEWGAVAYLSMSVYGKNGEVWNNPYYNNASNYSPITGLCSNESNGKNNETTDITKTCKYNEVGGGNASTTGNVYGVYDMAGGAWEYVAGYLSEKTAGTNYTTLASADSKYKDVYAGTLEDRNANYKKNIKKYGDAIYETSSSGNSTTGSWYFSRSYFPKSSNPVFRRGGHVSTGSPAGMFEFGSYTGGVGTDNSFRPVVLIDKN